MSRRRRVAPLLLGAALVVASASWWLSDNPLPADAHAAPQPSPRDMASDPTSLSGRPETSTREASPPPLENDEDGFASTDLWAHISDPANSDLPPDLFAELSALGTDVVRADTTGVGRDRWPGYWAVTASGRADPCCSDMVIHAVGAFPDPGNHDAVRVTVVWSEAGALSNGESARMADILLTRDHESWLPARR
jgi:hypothetical protein